MYSTAVNTLQGTVKRKTCYFPKDPTSMQPQAVMEQNTCMNIVVFLIL